ncbi:MAG: hypothetical protein WC091_17100 [Sulfuricellaceae bacterium]
MDILNDILQQSFLRFLWVGSIAGILIGGGILFKPQQIIQLNQDLSRWVNSDKLGSLLNRPRTIERYFYRYHRLGGGAVTIGALIVLYTFLIKYNLRTVSEYVPQDYWWLSDALMVILIIGSTLAVLVGTIVLTKPSLLRDIEKAANHWVSSERLSSIINRMNTSAEHLLFRHHRLSAVLIILGSLYSLTLLSYFMFWN